jgi:hypothetical protein
VPSWGPPSTSPCLPTPTLCARSSGSLPRLRRWAERERKRKRGFRVQS